MTAGADARLRDALRTYFSDNGFAPDGGYGDPYVKIMLGPVPFLLPNPKARRRVLPHHDLHHVATGYPTTLKGEAEIGAWEVATGCERFVVAWGLNLLAMSYGVLRHPRAVHHAFFRGRATRNTYRMTLDDALLERSVQSLRDELGLERPAPAGQASDTVAFFGWSSLSLVVGTLVILAYAAPVVLAVALVRRWLG